MNTHNFRIIAIKLFTLCLLVACSSSNEAVDSKNELVIYPPPPDQPRIQYLTSFGKSTDITGMRSTFMTYLIGEEEPVDIGKPYGIDICNGIMYVCDTRAGDILVMDVAEGTFEHLSPSGRGALKKPINITADTTGLLYIADADRRQVVVLKHDGSYVAEIGDGSTSAKLLDVCIYGDELFITDTPNHQVRVYSKDDYSFKYAFPKAQNGGPADLFSPINLWVADGKVYVSDFGAFHVQVYTTAGEYLSTIGTYGRNLGQFARPKGLAVDRTGILYAVDAGFENVQMFNSEGELLMFFGGSYVGPGDMWLPANVVIDYDNNQLFEEFVDPLFNLKYLLLVTNQFGPDKVNIYGFVEPK